MSVAEEALALIRSALIGAGVANVPFISESLDTVAEALKDSETSENEWEYGCANFGDLDDVMTLPGTLALQGKTEREWAEGVLQPEYGDLLVRRRRVGAWEVTECSTEN